ncbi:TetR/AcrR family transcriptional regulator [Paucibacter sediminis]|uniref:TetR/AcrR family transcriptional regulator n=1 Tax=Paucibacter sediminis TaxID=3019553 RepID=A0AA95NG22_9BURK|nr:TetR/AcrR family transcriptional regulator [Paucibacter sp. S2-9]WIT13570.1 TetR/AcrR family transcriptional regulator [Paucibacter sp. S2-9]
MPIQPARKSTHRRRGAERDELREQILQAVGRLHLEGGYGAVTMRGVAQAVGISAMSLYRYFPNKSALLEQVWGEVLEASLQEARTRSKAGEAPIQRLRLLYAAYVRFWMERPQDFKLVFDPCNEIAPSFLAAGPASGFRRECETLIDACLGPDATPAQRQLAHDLCRLKVIGYLFTNIGMSTKPRLAPAQLLDGVLDDLEQQLLRARVAADAPA